MTATIETPRKNIGLSAEEFYEEYHDRRAELIEGEVIELSPAGGDHGLIAGELHTILGHYVRQNKLGRVCSAETGFVIKREPTTVRAPDIAFLSHERIGSERPKRGYWPFAPDLAVEVVSPGDTAEEVEAKIKDWFDGGTRQVWIVYPSVQTVHVYDSAERALILNAQSTLSGGEVVPGFKCLVAEIFA